MPKSVKVNFRQILYRITLISGHVFGEDGTTYQTENGMPTLSPKILKDSKYWLTRAGWEVFGAPYFESSKINGIDLKVEQMNEPAPHKILYKDIFQVVIATSSNLTSPFMKKIIKKKKSLSRKR